jgi:hypothetical protein
MPDDWHEEWVVEWIPAEGKKVRMIYDEAKDALAAVRDIGALGFAAEAYRRMHDGPALQDVEETVE